MKRYIREWAKDIEKEIYDYGVYVNVNETEPAECTRCGYIDSDHGYFEPGDKCPACGWNMAWPMTALRKQARAAIANKLETLIETRRKR